jgi:hypothetical protein
LPVHRRLPFWPVLATALSIAAALAGGAPRAALAAPTYTVTDGADTTIGKSCAVGSPTCTLRLAVQTANANPGSTINVTSGLVITFAPVSPPIGINAAMTIQTTGAGNATVDGTNATIGVLVVGTFSPVSISGLNIQNGSNILGGAALVVPVGGVVTLSNLTLTGNGCPGVGSGGAINNGGTLTLNNVAVTNNGAGCILGGGIYSSGSLTLNGGSVSGNTVTGSGGGVFAAGSLTATGTSITNNNAGQDGGGVLNAGPANLTRVNISNNTATVGRGGGISVSNAMATLADSTLAGNHVTTGRGGGIALSGSTLTVTGSTISDNQAFGAGNDGQGGGIWMLGSLATLTNTTMAGNTGSTGGGAVYLDASTANLDSATVVGGGAPVGAGLLIVPNATASLRNSILAYTPSNCAGTVTSQGYNIDSANTCALIGPGDKPNTDPNLLPLASNGGPTQTMALLATSPAINAGAPACPPPATDQRGVARPQGSRCDIGAYEFEAAVPPPPPLPAPPPTGRE